MELSSTQLIEESIKKENVSLSASGALITRTGRFTGRAPENRYIAKDPSIENEISWGANNQPLEPGMVSRFTAALAAHVEKKAHYTFNGYLGPYALRCRSVSAWHTLFASNMFRSTPIANLLQSGEIIEIYHDPDIRPKDLGIPYEKDALVALDFVNKRIAIAGTQYAGEIKKAAFTIANFILPPSGILPMHASANCLPDGSRSCVLFGLSGTGKTTLSASPDRALIGDDEIIWTNQGLYNLEGGCYAKLINLKPETEPEIYAAVNRFGAIQENVGYDPNTRLVNYDDNSLTENTRGCYPIEFLRNVFSPNKAASEPETIVFLTADAFGALPAVARLSPEQAQFHFVSGYTARVAGTELGVKEPKAVFSTCFGAPFMPRFPMVYAKMLAERAAKSGASFWLLNTGWTQGGYAKGQRFPLKVSRTLLSMIQSGQLAKASTRKHPVFGFEVPATCPTIEDKWLESPQGQVVTELQSKFENNPLIKEAGLRF
jgi:phosphoenolpyruvate carboxykinase (ATP)